MATSFETLLIGERINGSGFGAAPHVDGEALITRMITDWADPLGAVHRRLETRWLKPLRPGDTARPSGVIKAKQATDKRRYVVIDIMVRNQSGDRVATGEAMVEFPRDLICP